VNTSSVAVGSVNRDKKTRELPMTTYQVKNIKPKGLLGISDKQIDDHWKLYEGYVKQVNSLTNERHRFGFEYNGMVLHEYYFENLIPGGTQLPDSPLKNGIEKRWGSFDAWKKDFIDAGKTRGIGWAILYTDGKNFNNYFIFGHDIGHVAGFTPLLVMDVWEHAYMVDHNAGGRAAYIDAFFKNVNWTKISTVAL
jgi:Fe-Mn family superoxide dismutase